VSHPTDADSAGGLLLIGAAIGVIGLSLVLVIAHVAGWL
jgi:hypothetical protein